MKEQLYLIDGEGKRRKAVIVNCYFCKEEMMRAERFVKPGLTFFHKECKNKNKIINGNIKVSCSFCGGIVTKRKSAIQNSKSGLSFCDRKCKEKAQSIKGGLREIQPPHYGTGDGSSSYRRIADVKSATKCSKCGYNKTLGILEVHHKDCDRTNNKEDNLEILCPNCHEETHYLNKTGKFRRKKTI